MKPFEHGGDVTAFAKTCGCKVEEVIDLSSNINIVKPMIDFDFNTLDISPYPHYDLWYDSIASHYNVTVDELEVFNGGSAAIFSLFKYLKHQGDKTSKCTLYSPVYLEYKKAAETFGYELFNINRYDNIDAEINERSFVIFVNPSTPDGIHYNIDALLEKWMAKKCTILIDESFLEFTKYKSMSHNIKNYDKFYILKSMTKFYGAAGIRIGVLISNSINISLLHKYEPAWKVSTFDIHYIQEALKDTTLSYRTEQILAENSTLLLDVLEHSKYVHSITHSEANYLLVTLQNITAKELQKKLIPFKILIRDCSNFDGLSEHHVRIAIKEKSSIARLKVALDA
jgi:threonine-phosphate decarboxylase